MGTENWSTWTDSFDFEVSHGAPSPFLPESPSFIHYTYKTSTMAMVGGLNAKRFAGKPLRQPTYSFKDIPRCNKDLEGSSLHEVTDRDQINNAMAEMILLCNETMRRLHIEQKVGKRTSKPLSLEYIADRLDIDDPMFGYFVRTDTPPPKCCQQRKVEKGHATRIHYCYYLYQLAKDI